MTSHPPSDCCAVGVRHDGTPVGEMIKIDNINTYISYPKDPKNPNPESKSKSENAILILTDIFGIYINTQLIADSFAAHGYLAVIPDLFNGSAITTAAYDAGKVDVPKWIAAHPAEGIDKVVEATIKHLRASMGIKKIGGVGYCLGGKYVVRFLKQGGGIDVGFNAHPSFVTPEELKAIDGPLAIAAAEIDHILPRDKRYESEQILSARGLPYQITLYSGVHHGFAARADLTVRLNRWTKEQAFLQGVNWFGEWL